MMVKLGKYLLMMVLAAMPVLALAQSAEGPVGAGETIEIKQLDDRIRVEAGGELLTEYRYKDLPRPLFFTVIGPTGAQMTRSHPLGEKVEGEKTDHVHHKGLWFTHGAVNGIDFWTDGNTKGKIVHEKAEILKTGGPVGEFTALSKWVAPDGKALLEDRRVYRLSKEAGRVTIDFDITLTPIEGPVTFGDTKEGSMAIRLPQTMVAAGAGAQGHIVTSAGVKDGDAWGTKAEWVDYYGPVGGKVVGVAILDNPKNPRFPTWWHVRDYGLFAANPFGQHDFEKKPAGTGDLTVQPGSNVRFQYRVILHEGDAEQAGIAGHYQRYAAANTAAE